MLSGNRNFDGRIHGHVKANFLASPPLVVAYALAGTILRDLVDEPLGTDAAGEPVYLRDIWPADAEIQAVIAQTLTPQMFRDRYAGIRDGTPQGRALTAPGGALYRWRPGSHFIRRPPYARGVLRAAGQGHRPPGPHGAGGGHQGRMTATGPLAHIDRVHAV